MWFTSVIDGVGFSAKFKLYSPMIARLQILKHGSNKNRKKLTHIPKLDLTYTSLQEPVIKGRGYKPRALSPRTTNKRPSYNSGIGAPPKDRKVKKEASESAK